MRQTLPHLVERAHTQPEITIIGGNELERQIWRAEHLFESMENYASNMSPEYLKIIKLL
jgi:hypothetical protein